MRKVVLFMMTSLDGFYEGPHHDLNWHNVDEEFQDFAIGQLDASEMLLFGRKTFAMMETFWTSALAQEQDLQTSLRMTAMDKYVCSHDKGNSSWENTIWLEGNGIANLDMLKQSGEGDILLLGSGELASCLLIHSLLDELRIMVNPVVLGKGTVLFPNIEYLQKLRIQDTRLFDSGNVLLSYSCLS